MTEHVLLSVCILIQCAANLFQFMRDRMVINHNYKTFQREIENRDILIWKLKRTIHDMKVKNDENIQV